jgi:hypothetical protein
MPTRKKGAKQPMENIVDGEKDLVTPPNSQPPESLLDIPEEFRIRGVQIDAKISPIVRVFELGVGDNPSSWDVQIGTICVAVRNQNPYDHDNLAEAYLNHRDLMSGYYLLGETITKSPFRGKERCVVAVLAERSGWIRIQATQKLPGISLTEGDQASAQFVYFLRIDDPIALLSAEPSWHVEAGQQRLQKSIQNVIRREINSILHTDVQLWTSCKVREVSDRILERLDRVLAMWGLRLWKIAFADRRYPSQLQELVLQFASAEIELLESKEEKRNHLLHRLGLSQLDLVELQNTSEKRGPGAGLFVVAANRKNMINSFIEWLGMKQDCAILIAKFLGELNSGKYDLRDIELTKQVILSAFKHPLLGIGEWGDEARSQRMSEYLQLGAYVQERMAQGSAMREKP